MNYKSFLASLACLFLFSSFSFSHAPGHFAANVIASAANRGGRTDIYDKLAVISYENQKGVNDIWIQSGYKDFFLGNESGSEGDFRSCGGGMNFGLGKEIKTGISAGFFGSYNRQNLSQNKSAAGVNSYGIGAYGSYLYKDFDFKGIFGFYADQYCISRYSVNGKARSDFNGYGINADFEAAMWIEAGKINLRPYAGFSAGYTGYGSSAEIGAKNLNLKTGGGGYTKSSLRAGAGANGKYGQFGWYGGLELELMLAGRYAEIESSSAGPVSPVKSKGAKKSASSLGLNAGGDYNITNRTKIYMNFNYRAADGYGEFAANAGLAFVFNSF